MPPSYDLYFVYLKFVIFQTVILLHLVKQFQIFDWLTAFCEYMLMELLISAILNLGFIRYISNEITRNSFAPKKSELIGNWFSAWTKNLQSNGFSSRLGKR